MKTTDAVIRLRRAEAELQRERALRLRAEAANGGLRGAVARLTAVILRQRAAEAERKAEGAAR